VQEEVLVSDMLQRLRLAGNNNNGLFLIVLELGQRQPDAANDGAGG